MQAQAPSQAPRWMPRRLSALRAILLSFVGLSASGVLAQAPVCGQIRAEIASLRTGGGGGGAEVGRLRSDLARVRVALQQNDCNSRGFLGFGGPPPVCSP